MQRAYIPQLYGTEGSDPFPKKTKPDGNIRHMERLHMNKTWITFLAGASVAGSLMIGGVAHAGYNDLIKTLEAKGTITADEAADLKAQEVTPDKGDAKSLKITGRVQFQAGYVDQENDVNSGDWSTFEVRRARIGVSGNFTEDIKGKVEANIVPGSVSVRSAFISWGHSDAFNLTGGYDKPVSSLEENTSSASILTVERSNVNNNIAAPGESVGLWADGEAGLFFYHLGLYNGESGTRNTSNEEAEYLFNAHGGLTLDLAEDTAVTVMVSYLETDDPNAELGYEDVTTAAIHFEAGAFDLRTEYFMGSDEDGDTDGFYIMPSMKLSKQLEAVLRYEQAESDSGSGIGAQSRYAKRTDTVVIGEDKADKGDEFSALYLGMNYYFAKYQKVMVGVEVSELENTDAGKLDTTSLFGAYRVRF